MEWGFVKFGIGCIINCIWDWRAHSMDWQISDCQRGELFTPHKIWKFSHNSFAQLRKTCHYCYQLWYILLPKFPSESSSAAVWSQYDSEGGTKQITTWTWHWEIEANTKSYNSTVGVSTSSLWTPQTGGVETIYFYTQLLAWFHTADAAASIVN